MEKDCLVCLLHEAGMDQSQIDAFLSCRECGCSGCALKILREGRSNLLKSIHRQEEILSRLDVLIYTIEEEKKK